MNNNNGQGTANIVSPDQDNDWERKPKCDTIISTMRVIQENEYENDFDRIDAMRYYDSIIAN